MLAGTPLICPQCGGALPRQAAWRMVTCPFCAVEVTRAENVVRAAIFHEAYQRAHGAAVPGAIVCGGHRYLPLGQLGSGDTSRVMLAQRTGPLPELVVLKLAHASATPGRLKTEYENLKSLQADQSAGSAYFSQRLPQPVGFGMARESDGSGSAREALVLRHAPGFEASLEDVKRRYRNGIDPRHAIWMWRRVLEVLAWIHPAGWVHGNLSPGHLLVHPGDHGILIIGWADARRSGAGRASWSPTRDLMQSAWTIRALLAGGDDEPRIPASTPAALAAVLKSASEDAAWCAKLGADGIDQAVKSAARADFGPPQFVRFTLAPHA